VVLPAVPACASHRPLAAVCYSSLLTIVAVPLLLMTARSSPKLPRGEGRWAYEPKFDGFLYLTLVPG
jgi:ATP-dependent DNA ligase